MSNLTIPQLIKLYEKTDYKLNSEGKKQFCLELMEYMDDNEIDMEMERLLTLIKSKQEVKHDKPK